MRSIFFLLFFWAATYLLFLDSRLQSLAQWGQSLCVSRAITTGEMKAVTSAVICGKRIEASSPLKQSAINLGLIHLLVVSGAHLGFFANGLRLSFGRYKLFQQGPWLDLLLFFFVIFAGAGIPVLRAYVQRQLRKHLLICQIHGHICILLAGFFCFLINPLENTGLSLALSWTCALSIWISRKKKALFSSSLLYLCLFPLMCLVSIPHPVSIIANTLLLPIFSVLIFPLLLLTWLIPSLHHLFGPTWKALEAQLISMGQSFPTTYNQVFSPSTDVLALLYAISLQVIVHLVHRKIRREKLLS